MNHYLEEFCRTTEELLGSDAVRMMGRWKHHGHISTLDHSLFVAYCSYRAARALRLDETAAARAGLLHDLYLYDSRDTSAHPGWQCFDHPRAAARNAAELTALSEKERNIILSHMWPLGGQLPPLLGGLAGGPGGHPVRRPGAGPHLSPRTPAGAAGVQPLLEEELAAAPC